MLTNKKISAVVVCYRDEGNVKEMFRRLSAALTKITPDWEIIYVNDNSPDKSEQILKELAQQDSRLTIINQSRNFGAQAAFTAGMVQALGDAVVIMDGDLQDPPELIEEFVKKWLAGNDVVYGIRKKREKSMGRFKEYLYHKFYTTFNKMAYMNVPEDAGEFSLMDRKVIDWLNSLPERDRLIRGLRAWVGFKQIGISYVRPERFWGTSTNNMIANTKWARKAIFSFSYKPLEWISFLAFWVVILSVIGVIFYIISFFIFPEAPRGITSIVVIVLFLGAIQLLALSIIAEYIARIFEETKQRPRYISREIINDHRKVK